MKINSMRAVMLTLGVACGIPYAVENANGIEEKVENAVSMSYSDIFCSFPKMDWNQKEFLSEYLDVIETDTVYGSLSAREIKNIKREDFQNAKQEEGEQKEELEQEEQTKQEEMKGEKGQADKAEKEKSHDAENTGLSQLQIPEKLEVVIDPWKLDGKSQIHSKPYVIRNMGVMPGTLTLSSLVCVPQENSIIQVCSNQAGLHEGGEKSVYMQMVFGNGNEIILSEEDAVYQARLQPGEELSLCLTGEVNEYASDEWKDSDLNVQVTYLWEVEEYGEDSIAEKIEEPATLPSKGKTAEYERSTESEMEIKSEDIDQTEDAEDRVEIDESKQDRIEKEESAQVLLPEEGKKIEEIEVEDLREVQIKVNAWETGEDDVTRSGLYRVRNTGVYTGTFSLTKLVDDTEAVEILVQPEGEALNENGTESIYMEFATETGEESFAQETFAQEYSAEPKVNVELDPGEEALFRIAMRREGMMLENLKDGVLTVVGAWRLEERKGED